MERVLRSVGVAYETKLRDDLSAYDKLVLPGVGAFTAAMDNIREQRLDTRIKDFVDQGGSLFGICLGMQLLFSTSIEGGQDVSGLGLIPGRVTRLAETDACRLPHIGWNEVIQTTPSKIFNDVPSGGHFYFQHSFAVRPEDPNVIIAESVHSERFPCAVQSGTVFGVQFHPEKSYQNGFNLMQAFLRS